jgi:hypothetical protein
MPRVTLRQTTARNLADSVSSQKLFDVNTTGAIDLVPGTYEFECQFALSAMSATSGNCLFSILGAGTATCAKFLWQIFGAEGAGFNVQASKIGALYNTGASSASMVTANTGVVVEVLCRGTFECTVAGTIIPSVTLVTGGVTPQVEVGSQFTVDRIGPSGTGVFVEGGYRTTISEVLVPGTTLTITYNDGTVRVDKL